MSGKLGQICLGLHRTRYKVGSLLPPPSIGYSLSDLQTVIQRENEEELNEIRKQSPIDSFRYALKSYEARRQYPRRLKILFDFLDLSGTLEEQAAENTWTNQDEYSMLTG